jgi:hypothetical protein
MFTETSPEENKDVQRMIENRWLLAPQGENPDLPHCQN